MTQTTSSQLAEVLAKLQLLYPDWRFGQLVCNLAGWCDVNVWNVEDEQLLAIAQTHLEHVAAREAELQVS